MKFLIFVSMLFACEPLVAAPRYAFNNGNQQVEIKNSIVIDLMSLTVNTDCRPTFIEVEDEAILFTFKRDVVGRLNIKKKGKIIYSEFVTLTFGNYHVFYTDTYNFIRDNCESVITKT